MKLLTRIRRLAIRYRHEATARAGIDFRVDRRVFARAFADGAPRTAHVLIAPPGAGNIGDQAMVEAFLENTDGPVRIITRRPDDITIPADHLVRAEIEAIPGLIYGDDEVHRAAVSRFGAVLSTAASLSVIGADIMDGAYTVRASARRADVAALARSAGVDARILGFSWNGNPNPGAKRALRGAAAAGTRLLVRDPRSAQRAIADRLANVHGVADLVFSARTTSADVRDEVIGDSTAPYAVVNASGLVARAIDQVTEYSAIVRGLLDAGLRVVLLPHVLRSSADDAVACAAVAASVDDERVILVDRMIAPPEVRGLCAGAQVVITGRMHLAIQAMWSGVPAITLSTQGKVEGLMQLFDATELCVEPRPGLARAILPLVARVLAERPEYVTRIAERMPAVTALSAANFDDLPPVTT